MREVVCRSFAPLDQLVIEERPSPELRAGQLRVRVTAAGVNFVDALLVQGLYQIKPPLPFVAGGESVGVVSEVGEGVSAPAVGDRVLVSSGLGGFATEMIAPADRVWSVPAALTDGQAATFMQSYMTAYFALKQRARMRGRPMAAGARRGRWGGTCRGRRRSRARVAGDRGRVVAGEAGHGDEPGRGRGDRLVDRGREGTGARDQRRRGRRGVRPSGRHARRGVPAQPARRRPVPRDRLRVGRHPEAAREPGAAAQPARDGCRVGRLGRSATRPPTRRSSPRCSPSSPTAASIRSSRCTTRSRTRRRRSRTSSSAGSSARRYWSRRTRAVRVRVACAP